MRVAKSNAFEFMKKVSDDSQLQAEIERLLAGKEGKETDAAVAELAKTHGCEFTADESFQARSAVKQQQLVLLCYKLPTLC